MEDGSFRRDLYYRLNALTVVIPPLRERGDDIFLLLEHFKKELNGAFELSGKTEEFLRRYPWPGNIRELHNAAEYFNYTGKQVVELEDLPPTMSRVRDGGRLALAGSRERAEEQERAEIRQSGCETAPGETEWSDLSLHWLVLEQLFLASEQGRFVGREKILQCARERYLPASQKQVRDILRELSEQGLAVSSRGRGGSRITGRGRACWLEYEKSREHRQDE